jgi:hypothetical protein
VIDVKHQINEVRRDVGTTVLEAGEARVITVSQTYQGSLDDVWDACTNPERLRRWLLPPWCRAVLALGTNPVLC